MLNNSEQVNLFAGLDKELRKLATKWLVFGGCVHAGGCMNEIVILRSVKAGGKFRQITRAHCSFKTSFFTLMQKSNPAPYGWLPLEKNNLGIWRTHKPRGSSVSEVRNILPASRPLDLWVFYCLRKRKEKRT